MGPWVPSQWHLPTRAHTQGCSWLTPVPISDTITLPLLPLVSSSLLRFPVGDGDQLPQGPRTTLGPQWAPAESSPETTGRGGAGWWEWAHRSLGGRGWEGCIQEFLPQVKEPGVVDGEGGQEQHLERKTRTPSSRATPNSSPKTMATISPPVRTLETVGTPGEDVWGCSEPATTTETKREQGLGRSPSGFGCASPNQVGCG